VWTSWEIVYRDVVIVDDANERIGVYNLTEHDLGEATNREELMALLRGATSSRSPAAGSRPPGARREG
jgi:hypothetical protein